MMEKLTIIKVGGKIVEDDAALSSLIHDFSRIDGHKILVHGGGRSATSIASRLGIETKMVDGRRITDRDMLDVVMMVYGGLVNKKIVAGLQSAGVNAIGLTGADMNIIRSHKREVKDIDYGFVGDVDECDGQTIKSLLSCGAVPVIAPLTHDGHGQMLNTNADTMASVVAKAMSPMFDVTLTYTFEKKGVLLDADDDDSVIERIDDAEFERLVKTGQVQGGMIPKLTAAFEALRAGVRRVIITSSSAIDGSGGTLIEL